jgi:hypothetical protein
MVMLMVAVRVDHRSRDASRQVHQFIHRVADAVVVAFCCLIGLFDVAALQS